MIDVTRLNGEEFVVNALYIEKVQALPDTTITLSNGKTYFVKESRDEIIQRTVEFYQQVGLIDLQAKVVDEDVETD
ncbi:flagellar FlbD family protein [Alkalibacillus salilacus]|uniref:Flagellar protein FlbD n=1 Tax=Alkalibacillus salilacus TaxID=284582 RepID=A0ABT9VDP8_9BACI|nr:flagellar FlbD family protein [Alkalibacillus salilacus]MDQ0159087.1 flagellar protein FlbD [Alkalibacillus salilacus]